jgi:dipeptidase E
MRLLLFSNSTNTGESYLNYTLPYIEKFLAPASHHALFIPYAGISVGYDAYFEMVRDMLGNKNIQLISSIHRSKDKKKAVRNATVIIIGGGNTFYLLKALQDENLLGLIRERILDGVPYIGWSAGANVVCPTIRTTNDMPIVEPESFNALDLIPFQINPHYTDFVQKDHAGESRDTRIAEFILVNQTIPVVGLREGTLLQVEGSEITLKGNKNCRIFRYKSETIEISPGEDLNFLMK